MSLYRRIKLARDRSVTVANLVDELLQRGGDREVSVEESGPRRLKDLHADVCGLDRFLRDEAGLKAGQPVAIYRTNSVRCFHWFLAIIRAGGIAVPLNPMLTLPEAARILADGGIDILVTDAAVFERTLHDRTAVSARTLIQSDESATTLEGFLRAPAVGAPLSETLPPAEIDPAATIAVFHTSGTSGVPKGAALSSRALLGGRSSTVLAGLFLGSRDLALVALPWSHIMGVSIALYGLMAGLRGYFLDRFEVDAVLSVAERHRVTTVVGVPTMFARLVNSEPAPERLRSVRVWLSASDYLPPPVRERLRLYGAFLRLPLRRRIPAVLLNGYGMVELGGLAMMGVELSFLKGSGDLCFPVPPFEIRVVDDAGQIAKRGQTGECQIRRHGLEPHYWHDALGPNSLSSGLLTVDGWLRTGDLATRNRLGLIRIVGRIKDVIKCGGYSVYVPELEQALLLHPAVLRVAAFGQPHPEKGEVPVAVVELHSGFNATEADLLAWGREKLAAYKAPRHILIVESGDIPYNHTGKIMRRELRDRYAAVVD